MEPKLIHVIASVADEATGPSYSVPNLCRVLAEQGNPVTLMYVSERTDKSRNGCEMQTFRQNYSDLPVLARLRFSSEMQAALRKHARHGAILHAHGLWLMPNIYPAEAAREFRVPLIMAPRGMLGPEALKFSRMRKQLMWHILQKRAVGAASCLHATSEQEYREIRAFGLSQPVAVVPNGIDVPSLPVAANKETAFRTDRKSVV